MTTQPTAEIEALRGALSTFKQELARVIVGMQTGGDRKQRRDLTRRMAASKRRARSLARDVEAVLATMDAGHESRPELETAAIFLVKVQDLGNAAT